MINLLYLRSYCSMPCVKKHRKKYGKVIMNRGIFKPPVTLGVVSHVHYNGCTVCLQCCYLYVALLRKNFCDGTMSAQEIMQNYYEKNISELILNYNRLDYLNDHLCGLVIKVPGYTKEMYCVSCEVRTQFIYVMY
jgi:hypothetical protein